MWQTFKCILIYGYFTFFYFLEYKQRWRYWNKRIDIKHIQLVNRITYSTSDYALSECSQVIVIPYKLCPIFLILIGIISITFNCSRLTFYYGLTGYVTETVYYKSSQHFGFKRVLGSELILVSTTTSFDNPHFIYYTILN